MNVDIKIEQHSPQINEEADSKAYVYCHRGLYSPDTPVKIGSHTGTLARLWSRYKTTTGMNQELKIIEVKVKEVRTLEKAIQLLLEREGYWLELELFRPPAWEEFDRIAQPFMLPRTSFLHLFKKEVGMKPMVAITVPDDLDDFQVIPVTKIDMGASDKRDVIPQITADDAPLTFTQLSQAAFDVLHKRQLVRQRDTGDIFSVDYSASRHSFTFEYFAHDFISYLFNHPELLHPSRKPKITHFYTLLAEIKKVPSAESPFVDIPREDGKSRFFASPFYRFLSDSSRCIYDPDLEEGTPQTTVKEAYAKFLQDSGNGHLIKEFPFEKDMVSLVRPEWKIQKANVCKNCGRKAIIGCCPLSSRENRTTRPASVSFLRLI